MKILFWLPSSSCGHSLINSYWQMMKILLWLPSSSCGLSLINSYWQMMNILFWLPSSSCGHFFNQFLLTNDENHLLATFLLRWSFFNQFLLTNNENPLLATLLLLWSFFNQFFNSLEHFVNELRGRTNGVMVERCSMPFSSVIHLE